MIIKKFLILNAKLIFLVVAFLVIFTAAGGLLIKGIPDTPADPGMIPAPFDLVVVAASHALVLAWIIGRANWYGLKLAAAAAFSYYGTITFMAQIETWYFLSGLTVSPETLRGLFLMGIPTALLYCPLAVLVLGKRKDPEMVLDGSQYPPIPLSQWIWKFALIGVVYVALYYSAGYFIAWQNPELVAFYGGEDSGSFLAQLASTIQTHPGFLGFQFTRGMLFGLFTLPVIWMRRDHPVEVALMVAVLLSVPFNIGHILSNPLMPDASVRFSHMIETASSNFVFGLIIAWLLHRKHDSLRDLFGRKNVEVLSPAEAQT
jgi:hypothetical protein